MVDLAECGLSELWKEVHARSKNEFTSEEFTEEFWDYIEVNEDSVKEIAAQHDLIVMSDDEIQEQEQCANRCFELLTRLAYLPITATIRELQALQREARHELANQGQHQGIVI